MGGLFGCARFCNVVLFLGTLQEQRQADIGRSMESLRMANKQIVTELAAIVKALLGKATRPAMMAWLGSVIENNNVR